MRIEVLACNEPYIEQSQLPYKKFLFCLPLRPFRKTFPDLKKSLGQQNFVGLWPLRLALSCWCRFFCENRAVPIMIFIFTYFTCHVYHKTWCHHICPLHLLKKTINYPNLHLLMHSFQIDIKFLQRKFYLHLLFYKM